MGSTTSALSAVFQNFTDLLKNDSPATLKSSEAMLHQKKFQLVTIFSQNLARSLSS